MFCDEIIFFYSLGMLETATSTGHTGIALQVRHFSGCVQEEVAGHTAVSSENPFYSL